MQGVLRTRCPSFVALHGFAELPQAAAASDRAQRLQVFFLFVVCCLTRLQNVCLMFLVYVFVLIAVRC